MKGLGNHHFLENATFVGKARIEGFIMFDLGSYPGIVNGKDKEIVLGELYEINESILNNLDRLEGEGSLYKRITVRAITSDNT